MPDIDGEYSPTYKRINVGGIVGGIFSGGLEAVLYTEERRMDKVIATQPISPHKFTVKRTIEVSVIMDPIQAKAIYQWLGNNIAEYEKIFGRILSPEELESRTRKGQGT